MSVSSEQQSDQKRKRDWLDWGQGVVTLVTAILALLINSQQQMLKNQQDIMKIQQDKIKIQQDNTDLALKKESATTLFTDKIAQQLNTLSEQDSKIKGVVILELMGVDIQAHLLSRTDQDTQVTDLEKACEDIPSRIALFTDNYDALDARLEPRWVKYAYDTDNRIARHTALRALGQKALKSGNFSPAGSFLPSLASEGPATASLLSSRLEEILMLSNNLESRDLAIDALDAISRLTERFRDISSHLKGTDTLDLIRRRMLDLQKQLTNLQASNETTEQPKQKELQEQLTHLNSTWNSLIANGFFPDDGRHLEATGSPQNRQSL